MVISEIDEVDTDNKPIILIRSTVVPGTCDQIQTDHPNLKIVFNPEFLTERSALFDFLTQSNMCLEEKKKIHKK